MTPDDILAQARTYLETPFRHQGRLPGVGLDCAGLIVVTAAALNIEHVDISGYGGSPSNGMLETALDTQPGLDPVSLDALQPGDILLIRFDGDPQHLAFYAGDNIIHSYKNAGKVCEHGLSDWWRSRIVRAYRFKAVL